MKILIAEDDTTSKLFMKRFLGKYGQCHEAGNGMEAIDMVSKAIEDHWQYDLICLDIMMPKVDGVRALKSIRELEASRPGIGPSKVIMTTALNDRKTVEEAYDNGADAYVWKPIEVAKFVKLMKEMSLIP